MLDCISFMLYYIKMIICEMLFCVVCIEIYNIVELLSNYQKSFFIFDLMLNVVGICFRIWDRIGLKVIFLYISIFFE